MKALALEALDAVTRPGVSYADTRAMEIRDRQVSTKNGKTGHVSSGESHGPRHSRAGERLLGIRRHRRSHPRRHRTPPPPWPSKSRAPARSPRSTTSRWRPKRSTRPTGSRPAASIPSPFRSTSNLALLLAIDRELRRNPGVTLAEASMSFERAPPGLRLHARQPHRSDPLPQRRGIRARSAYKDGEIQKRSYPNSFGGQYQLKGYELIDELAISSRNAPRIAEEAVALHCRRSMPRRRVRSDPGQLAARPADSRIHRPSHRARPRAGQRGQLRGHELPHARSVAPPALRLGNRERGLRCAPRARPRPGHLRLRRRRRARAIHRHHPRRPVHRLHDLARNRRGRRRGALQRHHARRWLGAPAAHPHDQRQPAAGRSNRSTKFSAASTTPSTWRPTEAGPSTTSATTSSSAARSAGRSATASASAC